MIRYGKSEIIRAAAAGYRSQGAGAGGNSVKELYPLILEAAHSARPGTAVTLKDMDGCIVMINGVQGKKSSKLAPGDEVMLMSPVCGG